MVTFTGTNPSRKDHWFLAGNTAVKIVYKDKNHFFRKYQSYNMSVEDYNELLKKDIERVLLLQNNHPEPSSFFLSDLKDWVDSSKSKSWTNNIEDGQKDPQYALPIVEMTIVDKKLNNKGGYKTKMATMIETAQGFIPKQTKNIADLEVVRTDVEIQEENEVEFPYKYFILDGEKYRVPNSVLEQLQTILKEKPGLKTIKVTKKGEGLKTSYTVIPLE